LEICTKRENESIYYAQSSESGKEETRVVLLATKRGNEREREMREGMRERVTLENCEGVCASRGGSKVRVIELRVRVERRGIA